MISGWIKVSTLAKLKSIVASFMITSVGYQYTYKASQMDLHRSLVILLALISTACENKLPHAHLCFLQLTPPVKMHPM